MVKHQVNSNGKTPGAMVKVGVKFGSTISFGQPVICEDKLLSVASGIKMTGGGS